MSVVHRMGTRGGARCGARCGAGPDKFGHLKLSVTGAPSAVTCPTCAERPQSREAAIESLKQAAAKFRGES